MSDLIIATISGLTNALMTMLITSVAIISGIALVCWYFSVEMPSFHWPDISTLIILVTMWILIANMVRLDIDRRWKRRKMQRRRLEVMAEILAEKRKP